MRLPKFTWQVALLVLAGGIVLAVLVYQLPPVQSRLGWRVDFALTYLRGMVNPVGALPSALPPPQVAVTRRPSATPSATPAMTPTPGPTSTPAPTATPTLSPTPIPSAAALEPATWEKQDVNNCGPASLSMYLRYWGWEGDQFDIAGQLKPIRQDRNVNIDELAYYVRNFAGWLDAQYRVGGDLELLKKLLAAGYPVVIEEGFTFTESYWPGDDQWAAHYLLLTGYDDTTGVFTGQDSFYGADRRIPYAKLDADWQVFSRVYLVVYPVAQQGRVQEILGPAWDENNSRQVALETARQETQADPDNPFPWFNLGTNLVYFERYSEAAEAYDRARNLGLPQRMLRYQFGPFIAYFHTNRMDDLQAMVDYALKRTANSEEALLWQGWMYYRQGETIQALVSFRTALEHNPSYQDAQYALEFVNKNP